MAHYRPRKIRARAPLLSGALKTSNGTRAVVAVISTGARASHEALESNWMGVGPAKGAYGWFDPYEGTRTPYDYHVVGTHALGVVVGGEGIGVAPGTKIRRSHPTHPLRQISTVLFFDSSHSLGALFQTCKGREPTSRSPSALVACGQWANGSMVNCPTLYDGSTADCDKAPHVVLNPWVVGVGGGPGGKPFYFPVIREWQAVDIVPVFGVGAGSGEGGACEGVAPRGTRPSPSGWAPARGAPRQLRSWPLPERRVQARHGCPGNGSPFGGA